MSDVLPKKFVGFGFVFWVYIPNPIPGPKSFRSGYKKKGFRLKPFFLEYKLLH